MSVILIDPISLIYKYLCGNIIFPLIFEIYVKCSHFRRVLDNKPSKRRIPNHKALMLRTLQMTPGKRWKM